MRESKTVTRLSFCGQRCVQIIHNVWSVGNELESLHEI